MSFEYPEIDRCPRCLHGWHGLPCNNVRCNCPTAWTPPEETS